MIARSQHLGSRKSVLVVEDDEATRFLLRKALEKYGFAVTLACDGLDGLEKLAHVRPDIIISDFMMPRLDGLAFMKEVHGQDATRAIPIVFVTARGDAQSIEAATRAGARSYVTKPFRLSDLAATLHELLRGEPAAPAEDLADVAAALGSVE